MSAVEVTEAILTAAHRQARAWAVVHRHPQPDDRMVDAAVSAAVSAALAVLGRVEREQVTRPHRGDEVEAWIKRARDGYQRQHPTTGQQSRAWHALDDLLDDYRLHADTGLPLSDTNTGPDEES